MYLRVLTYTRTLLNNRYAVAYYSDKKKILLDLNVSNASKETCIPVNETIDEKTCDKIEKAAYENEDKILELIMREKETDASVRSRLSKECNALLTDRRMTLTTGLNLHLEHLPAKVCWENFEFDTVCTRGKQSLAPVVSATSPCDKKSGGSPPSSQPPATPARIVRGEPVKAIFNLIPEEWFKFFIPKTGVTGFWTFLFTYGIFLISKEYYILDHEFYGGVSFFIMWWYGIKNFGRMLGDNLDKEIDDYEKAWQKNRDDKKAVIESQLKLEEAVQLQADGELLLVAAKRENVALQLEDEFRKRQMHVYQEVLKRLQYHIAVVNTQRRIIHKNLIAYVTREVEKSITPDMQDKLIDIYIKSIVSEFEKQIKKP